MKDTTFDTGIFGTRTFGVEIEAFVPARLAHQFNPGRASQPNPILNAPVTSDGKTWGCARDGSLMGAPADFQAVEIVSPVLQGEDGFTDLLVMLDYLNEIGVQVNASCGIHIHVFAGDLTKEKQQAVIDRFKEWEKGFFALNGTASRHRWNNTFCQPSGQWLVDSITLTEEQHYSRYRYQSLNWQNIQPGRSQCFEFRLFAGDIVSSPDLLLTSVLTCIHFVEAVNAGTLRPRPSARRMKPSTAARELHTRLGLSSCPELDGMVNVVRMAGDMADIAFGHH